MALALGACAGDPLKQAAPERAPLQERMLDPAQREALNKAAGLPGPDGARANYFLGLDEAAQGRWARAGEHWKKVVNDHAGSGWDRPAQYKAAQALEAVSEGARAFVQYQSLAALAAGLDLGQRSRQACARLASSLDAPSLRSLINGYANEEFQSPMRLRLMELDMAAGRRDEARRGVDDYLKRYPQGPGLDRVQAVSKALEASVVLDTRALGLLLPMNGDMAVFGQQLRQGAELALAHLNQGLPEIEKLRLVIGDEAQPATALRQTLDEARVIGLLGPLSSDTAISLLPALAARRVPLFSPSAARPDLSEVSPWFFRNTLPLDAQAQAIAEHLVVTRGLTRVASLAPDNAYGQALARAFAQRVQELGGTVAASVTYSPGTRDFKAAFLRLGGVDPGEAKTAEADEKREQQARVEEASTALGRYLLSPAAKKPGLTTTAGAKALTVAARPRVLVLDLSQDEAAAALTAGRAFAERFARTLGQLDTLDVLQPQEAERLLLERGLKLENLSLQQVALLGQAAAADYVLTGGTLEDEAASAKDPKKRIFELAVQLVDPASAEIVAQRRFRWTKFKPPTANPLGLQALYLPAPGDDVVRIVPALVFFDLKLPLAGADQWDRARLREQLGDLEGAVFSVAFWPESKEGPVQRFNSAFRAAYAERPGLLAAQAYDAVTLMGRAVLQGAATREDLRAALSKTSGFEGVSGRTSFEGRQDAAKRPTLVRISRGAFHPFSER